ncbi:MAG TPA: hypothetical protein VFE33_32475 [Thermoanaerobaculia bacterium]|nr:hypothetical protein [Thermoanaerobaculia bacterium]
MERSTARRGLAVLVLAAVLALAGAPPAAAAGRADGTGWDTLFEHAWAWLTHLGRLTHLHGKEGSYIDPNGSHLSAPPGTSSSGLTHLRGDAGAYIDPNGNPQSAPPSGQAGSFIDPNGG